MIKDAIGKVIRGRSLSEKEAETAMGEILDGAATLTQIGSFVTALRMKGETVDEITGAAKAMRSKTTTVHLDNHMVNIDRDEINIEDETILDTCGTGGDGTNTFNVSTATALVAAGGGIRVAKHGQRTDSHHCGSADVLEDLGLKLDISRTDVERCIREVGIGFLYAPLFYGAMKYPVGPRREMGFRSIFNLLGPLTNPAGIKVQILGVYDSALTEKMAQVLKRLGTLEAFVVCGEGTFDEISICGATRVSHLKDGAINTSEITPEDFGFKRAHPDEISGGNAQQNAQIIGDILAGKKSPRREMVLLNAGAAFVAAGLSSNFESGIDRARESIDSGSANEKLEALVSFTQQCRFQLRE
ncbi:MAG: anthranilate phosphoribosyltransferase [Deltaproteobacteria bacterium]|nr:anthranilate phosphoribosyltransferase [Deltaproteobacteria bacterium]